jgi:predicted DCC family thiol-disulfide oxidoreductase YuxK
VKSSEKQDKIVFFDGECMLCNRSVDFLLKADKKKHLRFASLQSGYLKNLTFHDNLPEDDSIIFYDEGRLYTLSSAVLKIAAYLPMPYKLAVVFKIIPRPWRDSIYRFIARHRFRWFGKRQTCRMPDDESRNRILA